jgi:hypothetical protein
MSKDVRKQARKHSPIRTGAKLLLVSLFALVLGSALAGGVAIAQQLLSPSPSGATITSDKADYSPGAAVTLTGAGWAVGESVQVVVNDTIGKTWQHVADVVATGGSFSDVFNLPNTFISDYDVTATGPTSGVATTTFTDANLADLDQCGNGDSTAPQGCDTSDDWQNGNLNANQAHYSEGEFVPYRYKMNNLPTGSTVHHLVIAWDTTDSGDHGLDYIGSYNATETTANPCAGVLAVGICDPGNPSTYDTQPIPSDVRVTNGPDATPGTADDITQLPGDVTLFGGDIQGFSCPTGLTCPGGTSPYALSTGTYTAGVGYASHTITAVQIDFLADISDPILAVGGHISVRLQWAPETTAALINGSPYHMRLLDIDGFGGNQDRSLSAGAVTQPATVKIVKNSVGGDDTFSYTGTGTGIDASFSISTSGGTGSKTFSGIKVFGNKSVTESAPPTGWGFTNLDCDVNFAGASPGSTATPSSPSSATMVSTINLTEGGDVTCTYTNTKSGRIEIEKQTLPDGSSATFGFTGDLTSTLGDGGTDGKAVVPGTYHVTESAKTGWDLTNITCTDPTNNSSGVPATGIATFDVAAGETVRCTFTNTQRGSIIVKKVTNPSPNTTDSFTFTGNAAGTIKDGGTITVNGLVPGMYTSTEVDPSTSHFDLTQINCNDGGSATPSTGNLAARTATFKLDPGETVTCTFTNTQRAHLKVVKTENGQSPTIVYYFRLTGGPDNVNIPLDTTSGGTLDFGYQKPGTYSLCEENVPAGTTPSISTSGYALVLVDNVTGKYCVDVAPPAGTTEFPLTAGQDLTFNIEDSHPLGGQRTIGYWKNWNTCAGSNGNQVQNAAKTGHALIDDFVGIAGDGKVITLGSYPVDTCQQAVSVLTNAAGKWAENQLAAQLLAAKLNVLAASGNVCPAGASAIAAGDSLLIQIGYTGPVSKIVTDKHALRAQFVATASTLDQFNNELLC